jgi:putative membrane protein
VSELGDATRRTRLAGERTYLAWLRSGLTAFAVSIGTGRLVPELVAGPEWPWVVLGASFGVLGVVLVGFGFLRQQKVERALARGDYAGFDERMALALTVAGVALGVGTVLAVLFSGD